jgi:decaprenylphospho-beta-D-erythro-pentofuranosid-2-ulose 2-reductase
MLNGVGEFQRILVLGGKSEIALSILEKIPASEDAEIYLCGRDMSESTCPIYLKQFQTYNIETDFTEIDESKKVLEKVFEAGDIDLVIFAYATLGDENLQLDSSLFEHVLNTNFYSQAILLNEVYSQLSDQKHGQILLISSVAGMRPRRRNFVYGVSKFGVDFIAQGLQKISPINNLYITILRPGFVHTKMTSGLSVAPFATNKDVVAKIALKGLRRKKRIVYAPRILLLVMTVLRLLPERLFRILDK